jgi:hypothetical protein
MLRRRFAVGVATAGLIVAVAVPSSVAASTRPARPFTAALEFEWRWLVRDDLLAGPATRQGSYGQVGTVPLVCGLVTGIDRPTVFDDGFWHTRDGGDMLPLQEFTWRYGGLPVDIPVCGDWDGDGHDSPGIVRGNVWFLRESSTYTNHTGPATVAFAYGRPGDVPIIGDWDGDGDDTPGVRRGPAFYLRDSLTAGPGTRTAVYGRSTDFAVAGDWDGDGADTIGVVRDGIWYLTDTVGVAGNRVPFRYGLPTDLPVPGDWNSVGPLGDAEVGVVRSP